MRELEDWVKRQKKRQQTIERLSFLIDHKEPEADGIYRLLRRAQSAEEEEAIYAVLHLIIKRKVEVGERVVQFWKEAAVDVDTQDYRPL